MGGRQGGGGLSAAWPSGTLHTRPAAGTRVLGVTGLGLSLQKPASNLRIRMQLRRGYTDAKNKTISCCHWPLRPLGCVVSLVSVVLLAENKLLAEPAGLSQRNWTASTFAPKFSMSIGRICQSLRQTDHAPFFCVLRRRRARHKRGASCEVRHREVPTNFL